MSPGRDVASQVELPSLVDDDVHLLDDRAPCGLLSTTPDGTIVDANSTFLSLCGYKRDEIVRQVTFSALLSVGGRIYYETHLAPMLRMGGGAKEIAVDVVRPDGQRLPVLVNAVLECGPDGAAGLVRLAVFDAGHRREYERELLRAKERAEASEARATALARTLQQTLLPASLPQITGLDIAACYQPAGNGSQVGGDFYDVFQVSGGTWMIAVGDVCGKGVDAAVVTALARYTLRAATVEDASPARALRTLNQVLTQHESQRFATVVLLRLDRLDQQDRPDQQDRMNREDSGWSVVAASAGHPLPLLRRADGSVAAVGRPGSLLGVMAEVDVEEVRTRLRPGDALLLYTDGVPEARDGAEFYGEGRIGSMLAVPHATASELAGALVSDVIEFQRGALRDDVAIVALGVVPDRAPAMSVGTPDPVSRN